MDPQQTQVNIPHDDGTKKGDSQNPSDILPPVQGATTDPAPAASTAPDQEQPAVDKPDGSTAAGWQFTQEAESPAAPPQSALEEIDWNASEFIEHPKGFGWYALLGLAGLVVAVVNYLVTRDVVSTGAIVIAAVLFGIYAGHKPRMQQYHLSPKGLQIGEKLYAFQAYKAFSVTEEAGTANIVFTPLGRFAPPLTIYVALDMEDRVLNYLSNFLPIEQRRVDAVDGLLRRIRF